MPEILLLGGPADGKRYQYDGPPPFRTIVPNRLHVGDWYTSGDVPEMFPWDEVHYWRRRVVFVDDPGIPGLAAKRDFRTWDDFMRNTPTVWWELDAWATDERHAEIEATFAPLNEAMRASDYYVAVHRHPDHPDRLASRRHYERCLAETRALLGH